MGKDKNGTYVPPKGRPSGSGREGSGLRDALAVNDPEKDQELSDKYLETPDETAANVHLKHHNRNVDKGRENQGKETK